MTHHESNENLSPVELEFRDVLRHADDFMKIELLRPAKKWYQKALTYNIDKEKIEGKIGECDKKLKFERKIIAVVVTIAVLAIVAAIIF
ncbi:MAG: hypothetical protein U0W24_10340 [Bacteroidales bacterium]